MRLRNIPNAKLILKESGYLIQNFPISLKPNDIIELGSGKGEMICNMAIINPNIMFYAVEKYHTVALSILKKINKLGLNNVKIICEDIENIDTLFMDKVQKIWITFSDPWPKKRHAKRRLTHLHFLEKYKKILLPQGKICFKTDNDFLYDYTLESIKEYNCNIIFFTKDLHNSSKAKDNIMTEYEKKWTLLNKNINYIEFSFNDKENNGNYKG
ncbi:tRNA (guanosine(46)-N7)-methyltransferase TrmB [Mycoplasma elephantis]|uniref:tRNA (guanosine(46)-N7)-methyltransferase TrmB n=1 Tax=Mycoplasma elephantis TaxID=114882 RepID=UPI000692186D|nr:tRNA (guanosine(46)-N7)-methyltransferase TrmB [Mycoplasma elephantis]